MSESKPAKPAEAPKVAPKKSPLELKIEQSSTNRDRVTRNLMADLIAPSKSVDKFIEDACKFAKIQPPKKGEALASFVFKLQKQVCGFNLADNRTGCDGMLGPYTFAELIKKIPQLKVFSRETRTASTKAKTRALLKASGLPQPPKKASKKPDVAPAQTPKPKPKPKEAQTQLSEAQKATPSQTVTAGDSLTVQYGMFFYKRTGKYKEYRNKVFRDDMSIRWMRRKLEKNPDTLRKAKTLILGGGANDIYYRSPEWIIKEARKIIELARSVNPNIRIIVLKLHGDGSKYWKKKPQRTIDKIVRLNQKFDELVGEYSNIKAIDVRGELAAAKKKGKRFLSGDKLHYSRKGSQAIAAKLKDEVETGTSKPLHEYA